ncbi:MAG: hypothetical protein KDI36_18815, partial [Pseudomonadales bacterium]|nr:hypothetical protein [Pseudomonadales bacterium]
MRFRFGTAVILCVLWVVPATAVEDVFAVAQQAAQEGRYRDVVDILTELLVTPDLEPAAEVVAYSNRGIAYSLMKAYGLARKDLESAVAIMPDHALSLNQLGILAEQVEQDYVRAREYYGRAAKTGFAAAQVNQARLLKEGLGGPVALAEARRLLDAAAETGYSMAFTPLGLMYVNGEG